MEEQNTAGSQTYREIVTGQFLKKPLGVLGFIVIIIFSVIGIYAPLLASSKPLMVQWDGTWYFPLFRYLFYQGFFTKKIDIFFNLMMFTAPLACVLFAILRRNQKHVLMAFIGVILLQIILFIGLTIRPLKDPASDPRLNTQRMLLGSQCIVKGCHPSWDTELKHMPPYAQLNMIIRYTLRREQHLRLLKHTIPCENSSENICSIPTLWQQDQNHEKEETARLEDTLMRLSLQKQEGSIPFIVATQKLANIEAKSAWLKEQRGKLRYMVLPLVRKFHWEDDAGGEQSLNQYIPWYELTRINRKDLLAGLIFGIRISLVVGILAVSIAVMIGVPFGALAGYYGGKIDIALCRLLEVWESMPTFFMLLMVVAITQTKSIFLVISVVGIFGWTGFSRFIRGEFFKQRNLAYVEACQSLGFNDRHIMFSHILPNAIPPLLTLLPFAIMGAITSEAGLSFLGLGEEGSCSWGVLMDEGRSAFPGESYLLWPPAILLTLLLVSIALMGDALRDAVDPKMYE